MELKQLNELLNKLHELDIKYNYTSTISQIRSSLTQMRTQRTSQLSQGNVSQTSRQQTITNYKNNILSLTSAALLNIKSIRSELENYKNIKLFNQFNKDNPYGENAELLLNKIINEIDVNIEVIIQEISTYFNKLTAYNQFVSNSNIIFKDIISDHKKEIESNDLILFFEGDCNVENLKELSKVSTDWNQIINCFGRLTNENNTDIKIVSIEKGSLIATLTISAMIIGGVISASDKIMNLILKIYEIRVKALELKRMKLENISAAIEILEKQSTINLSEQSETIVNELMEEYGWNSDNPLFNETKTATIKAIKKMIRFHNSGGKVDANLLNATENQSVIRKSIREKNEKVLKIESEILNLTGSTKVLEIEESEIENE